MKLWLTFSPVATTIWKAQNYFKKRKCTHLNIDCQAFIDVLKIVIEWNVKNQSAEHVRWRILPKVWNESNYRILASSSFVIYILLLFLQKRVSFCYDSL